MTRVERRMYYRQTRDRDRFDVPGNYSGSAFSGYAPLPPPRHPAQTWLPTEQEDSPPAALLPAPAGERPVPPSPEEELPAAEGEESVPLPDGEPPASAPAPSLLSLLPSLRNLLSVPQGDGGLLGSLGADDLILGGLILLLITEKERDNEALVCLILAFLL